MPSRQGLLGVRDRGVATLPCSPGGSPDGGAEALLCPPESPREAWLVPALLPASQCTHTVSPMFTIVIHAHVTCTCVHAHDPAFGDHARLEPRLNAADNMHARARAFWCASRRTIQTGRTVCVYACFHQFLYSFCTVSVIPFALTSRERCQRAAWSACHVCCFRPPGGRPSCASADSVVLLSVHSTEFVLGLPRLLP